jgi:hypothetical protein
MSVVEKYYAVPSRIQAVYRYLLHKKGQWAPRDALEAALSPGSLLRAEGRPMLREVVAECEAMELIRMEGDRVSLHPDLPTEARDRARGESRFRQTLLDLFATRNERNHNLLRLIAWYLAQPIDTAPRDWEEWERALDDQVGSERFGMKNKTDYLQFNYWVVYLGFAWNHTYKRKQSLTPDPTEYLRRVLPRLFGRPGDRLDASQVETGLAGVCPVFEAGRFRQEVENLAAPKLPLREPRVFSSTLAHAWLCLQDEGVVTIESGAADAPVYLLPDGDQKVRCSGIIWRGLEQGN